MQGEIQALLDAGYQPLALVPGEKYPIHKGWTSRTIEMEELKRYNLDRVGLRTGDNGLEAIDVDSKNAENPEQMIIEFVRKLEAAGITDEMIVMQRTASEGVHILYRTDSIKGNTKIAKKNSGEVLVETRGKGGCIVVYDNAVLKEVQSLPLLTKEQRDNLWSIAASFDSKTMVSGSYKEFNEQNMCLDILLARGWKEVSRQGNSVKVLRDGNPTSTSSGTVFLDSNRAFIFSTSAGLPTEELLTPAAITCHFDFNGDWSAFGRSLSGRSKVEYTKTVTQLPSFRVQTMSELLQEASKLPPTKPLLGSLIFEGESTVFFGRTNVGKTTAAIQVADAIARGEELWGLKNSSGPMKVIYYDFEHSERQLHKKFGQGFVPSDNLIYQLTPKFETYNEVKSWKSDILHFLEEGIKITEAKVVFIDNVSVLQSDSTSAEDAVELVHSIKHLKEKYDTTLVILAHPTKQPMGAPLDINQLSGSSKFSSLVDAIFAMNFSNEGKNCRYIKALKARSDEKEYEEDNVVRLELKAARGYPAFEILGFGSEWELLRPNYEDKKERDELVRKHLAEGRSYREIADEVGIGKSTVGEIAKRLDVRPNEEMDKADTHKQSYFDDDGEPEGAPF